MDQKIQLLHPSGKKAVSIHKDKYDVLKKVIISSLKTRGESTHSEMMVFITDDFRKNKIKFEGSLEWYLEWVKLDLEARKEIRRVDDKSSVRFIIADSFGIPEV
jgi:hypothetical protein